MLSVRMLAGTLLVLICAATTMLSPAVAAKGASAEEKAVLASFQAVLDGLAKRDKAVILAQLLPGGNATRWYGLTTMSLSYGRGLNY